MKLDLKEQLDHILISTVELPAILDGFNSFLGAAYCGPYETMVFPNGQWTELYLARYSTEAEARAGHADIVARLRAVPDLRPEDVAEVLG